MLIHTRTFFIPYKMIYMEFFISYEILKQADHILKVLYKGSSSSSSQASRRQAAPIPPSQQSDPVSHKSHSAHKPSYPSDVRGTLKYRLQTHREDQEVNNHPPGGASYSLGLPYWCELWAPLSPTSASLAGKQASFLWQAAPTPISH